MLVNELKNIAAAGLFLASMAHAEPAPVVIATLASLLQPQQYSAPATVKPFNRPQLAAEVTGQIIRMPVRVGTIVKKDDLLAELDCRLYQARKKASSAALNRSQSQLNLAKEQLARANNLKRKSSISEELLDQRSTEVKTARADLHSQQASLEQAILDVQRCTIHAPFDALVIQRMSSQGSLANPGTPLIELVQLDQLEVSAKLRENEANTLTENTASFFSYQGRHYPLKLRAIPAFIDERTRTREARLSFKQTSAPIGAAGRLIWQSAQEQLPADYLVRRGSQLGIFIARENKATFIALPGSREGQPATVTLEGNEKLITEGRQRLQDGDAIQQTGPAS